MSGHPSSMNAQFGAFYRFTPAEIEDIKRRHRIEEVAAQLHLDLRRQGTHLVGLCPLHNERTPSFHVYPSTNSWHCFGGSCGKGGDVINLVMAVCDCTFRQALQVLGEDVTAGYYAPASAIRTIAPLASRPAQRASAADRQEDTGNEPLARETADGQIALGIAASLYALALYDSPEAQLYLHRRGVTEEVVAHCLIGFCPGTRSSRELLLDTLDQYRIPRQIAWDVGLIGGTGQWDRERFAGRIIIPEFRAGRPIWFSGRALEMEGTGAAVSPKYLALPGSRPLGGAEKLAGERAVVLVEGPFDWFPLVRWRVPGAFVGGSGFPRDLHEHVASADMIYIAFDRDTAGRAMSRTLADQFGSRACLVDLPAEVKDLGELGMHPLGARLFYEAIVHAALAKKAQRTAA